MRKTTDSPSPAADEAEELDVGDPAEFGSLVARVHRQHPGITVLGGCCGTDARHIAAVARAVDPHRGP